MDLRKLKPGDEVLFRVRWSTQIISGKVIALRGSIFQSDDYADKHPTKVLIEYTVNDGYIGRYKEIAWHRPRHIIRLL